MSGVHEEHQLITAGYRYIAGLDEVGRGCWAGPVVAAAVVFAPSVLAQPELLVGIEDSKSLSSSARAKQVERISQLSVGIGVGAVPPFIIDVFGIGQATRWAMYQALLALPRLPDAAIIDWLRFPELSIPQRSFPRADSISVSVAAASIIAKVRRDRLMEVWDQFDSRYNWASHKGYGTAAHRAALHEHGPCPLHRRSFRPIAALLNTNMP